jgi:CPA1 family monovalent cation:H+ antiporter
VWLTAGGIGLGLLGGWLVSRLERWINDGPIEITLSLLVPYAVYLAAQKMYASGVLATVACGLFLSRRSARFFSPPVRLQASSVWESLIFALNGLVIVFIGFQLSTIRDAIRDYSLTTLLLDGTVFSVLLILLRLVWVFPGARASWIVRNRFLHHNERPPELRQTFVIGWTGMRGVVALAAALALPVMLEDGSRFPNRNLIVFLTFCVICVTLVLQGVTLPPLTRALGLAGTRGPNREELEARRILNKAASWLENSRGKADQDSVPPYEELVRYYRQRLACLQPDDCNQQDIADRERFLGLIRETVRIERGTAIRLRDDGRINDEVLRRIERELDLTESRLSYLQS